MKKIGFFLLCFSINLSKLKQKRFMLPPAAVGDPTPCLDFRVFLFTFKLFVFDASNWFNIKVQLNTFSSSRDVSACNINRYKAIFDPRDELFLCL